MADESVKQQTKPLDKKWLLPVILSIMTLFTSGLLMLSHALTAAKITAIKLENKLASLHRIIPSELINNDLLADAVDVYEPTKLGHRRTEQLYLGTLNGQLKLLAIPVTARNGYSGDIELLVGVHVGGELNGQITAVEIIAHKETPGLGDLIEPGKSDWIQQFPNKSLQQPDIKNWKVKKDQGEFDQITAATITPRAVVNAVKQALLFYQEYTQKKDTGHE